MTVEDYQATSDFIDTLESDRELLDCLGFLYTLSIKCINKMYYNLPYPKYYGKNRKTAIVIKRETWYRLINYYTSLKMLITNY